MSNKVNIKDAQVQKVGGSASTITPVNSGNWIELPTSRVNFEFTTKSTSNNSSKDVDGFMVPNPNEVSSVLPTRLNVNVFLDDTQGDILGYIEQLQQSTNIKAIKGGIMTIDNMSGSFDDNGDKAIYVIVKNVTVSEVVKVNTNGVAVTIQLEQVR